MVKESESEIWKREERLGHQRKVWKVEGVIEADGEEEMTKEERVKKEKIRWFYKEKKG